MRISKPKKIALFIAILISLQVCALVLFRRIEDQRVHDRPRVVSTQAPSVESLRFERFVVSRGDGETLDLAALEAPLVVHFWGTWCPPCKWELPWFFAWAEGAEIDAMAVSLDEDRELAAEFTKEASPKLHGFGDASSARAVLHITTLPVTLLIEPGGRVRLRADGARDWRDARFQQSWSR